MNKILISDLDGTIIKDSLVLSHCGFLERRGIINTNGTFELWNLDRKNESLITQCAMAYQREITGLHHKDLLIDGFILDCFTENGSYRRDMYYDEILQEIMMSDKCHIITGSPQFLVEKLATLLGTHIEAHGSKYEFDSNGFVTGQILLPMFTAQCKQDTVDEILGEGFDFGGVEIIGCGDTMSDEPLFAIADKKILVEPTRETLIKYNKLGYIFDTIID